jgi:hypothetical protein
MASLTGLPWSTAEERWLSLAQGSTCRTRLDTGTFIE